MRWRHLLPPPPPHHSAILVRSPLPPNIPCCISALLSCFSPISPPHLALIFFVIFSTLGTLSSPISPSITCSLSLYPVLFQPLTRLFSLFLPFFSYRELKAACLPCCRLHTRTTKRGDRHTSPGCVRFRSALLWYRSAHQGVGVSARVLSICPLS